MGDIFFNDFEYLSQNKPELLDHMFVLLAELSNQNEAATIIIMIVRLGEYEVVSISGHTYHYCNHRCINTHYHFATKLYRLQLTS